MTEEVPDDLVELAEAYLHSLDTDNVDSSEVKEGIEYWQEQVEEFEEGTPMCEIAVEERDRLEERREEVSTKGERRERLRTELLTRSSTEFAPQEDWLHDSVISALTHALTGREQNSILLGDHSLPDDGEELSKREMVTVAKNVHAAAIDAVDSNDLLDEVWGMMSTNERYPISKVLAQERSLMRSGDIASELDDDATDNPGANLRYVLNSSEFYPYYRESGAWTLSLVGEYLWGTRGPDTAEHDGDGDDNDDDGDDQTSLDDVNQESEGDGDE